MHWSIKELPATSGVLGGRATASRRGLSAALHLALERRNVETAVCPQAYATQVPAVGAPLRIARTARNWPVTPRVHDRARVPPSVMESVDAGRCRCSATAHPARPVARPRLRPHRRT